MGRPGRLPARRTGRILVVILIVLCCCLPMVTGGIYFLAKSLGILPVWLGGSSGMALLMA
jgi:hypothetical protein